MRQTFIVKTILAMSFGLTTNPQIALSGPTYYTCQYVMESGLSKAVSGCTTVSFEAPSASAALDRCLGKTDSKEGLIGSKDCCAQARDANSKMAKRKHTLEVKASLVGGDITTSVKSKCK